MFVTVVGPLQPRRTIDGTARVVDDPRLSGCTEERLDEIPAPVGESRTWHKEHVSGSATVSKSSPVVGDADRRLRDSNGIRTAAACGWGPDYHSVEDRSSIPSDIRNIIHPLCSLSWRYNGTTSRDLFFGDLVKYPNLHYELKIKSLNKILIYSQYIAILPILSITLYLYSIN